MPILAFLPGLLRAVRCVTAPPVVVFVRLVAKRLLRLVTLAEWVAAEAVMAVDALAPVSLAAGRLPPLSSLLAVDLVLRPEPVTIALATAAVGLEIALVAVLFPAVLAPDVGDLAADAVVARGLGWVLRVMAG